MFFSWLFFEIANMDNPFFSRSKYNEHMFNMQIFRYILGDFFL